MCYCTVCFCNTVYKYNALYVNCMQCVLWAVQFQYIVGQLFFHCSVFFLWSTVYIVHCPSATLFCNPIILCTMLCILFCVHLNNVKCTSTMYIYIHCCAPQCFSPSDLWPDLTCTLCTILCYAVHQDPSSKKYSISGSAQITLYCEFCALCSILSMGMQPSTALLLRSWLYRILLCTLCTLYTVYTVYCTILSMRMQRNTALLLWSCSNHFVLCAHRVQFWGCNQVLLSF